MVKKGVVVGTVLAFAGAIAAAIGLSKKAKAAPIPPADIIVSDLVIYPTEVNPGNTVSVSCTVTNAGGVSGSYTVVLGGDFMAEKTITLAPGESKTVSFKITVPAELGTYYVELDGLFGSFEVIATPVADIRLSDLEITPKECSPGTDVTITCTAKNYGGVSGSRTITLNVT